MKAGIPLAIDVKEMVAEEEFQQHLDFHDRFRAQHKEPLKGYHWSRNPLQLWSRRWEYPFAAQRIIKFAQDAGPVPLKMLDAGSGVTYFPYFLCEQIPQLKVICSDSDGSYQPVFEGINKTTPDSRVEFRQGMLQSLPVGAGEIDILCCISVLEHTDDYGAVLSEFARVLRPGGLLVLTFDISLDGKWKLTQKEAAHVLMEISHRFLPEEVIDMEREFSNLRSPDTILSTNSVRKTDPQLLPWRWPMLIAIRDLFAGKGWSGGFKSKSIFCISVRSPHPDEHQHTSPPASEAHATEAEA